MRRPAARAPILGDRRIRAGSPGIHRPSALLGDVRSFGWSVLWNEVVASRFCEPNGKTHKLVALVTSWKRRSRPRCRSWWEPWMVTLPNTATAPVAAIASERALLPRSRSWMTARRFAPTKIASGRRSTILRNPSSNGGKRQTSARIKSKMPMTADWGAVRRMAVVPPRHTKPASSMPAVQ